ncbi:hypothetical protein [Streptacidiphilus sp. MAP12-33]|uniref:hypothetical protein n=1 Tax=Streptacidiphilus sp. MAP12-33 TaxID=3156266 RepID=UPI003511C02F
MRRIGLARRISGLTAASTAMRTSAERMLQRAAAPPTVRGVLYPVHDPAGSVDEALALLDALLDALRAAPTAAVPRVG